MVPQYLEMALGVKRACSPAFAMQMFISHANKAFFLLEFERDTSLTFLQPQLVTRCYNIITATQVMVDRQLSVGTRTLLLR